jgi:D-alanine-D-alanine ligase
MKVAIAFNLKKAAPAEHQPPDLYAECDDADTIDAIRAALAEFHQVSLIEADEDAYDRFRTERPDIVFNVAEGLHGLARESQVPAMLEMLRIPYTGSDPVTLAVCLDKARTKDVLAAHGVPVPAGRVVESADDVAGLLEKKGALPRPGAPLLRLPMIVKPLAEGSSKGITDASLARDEDQLHRAISRVLGLYRQPALVEEFLPGREFTVAMLGNANHVQCLPIVEIRFDTLPPGVNPIYSYEAKWVWDTSDRPLEIFDCPAPIDVELKDDIESVCLRAWRALGLRDWTRIDVRLDASGQPRVLEVNPLPGILPHPEQNSCFPKAARAAGLSYNALVRRVLDAAVARLGLRAAAGAAAPPAHFSLR